MRIGKVAWAGAAAMLVSACAMAAPQRVFEVRPSAAPAPRGDALLRAAMLKAHNDARAAAGVMPLAWSDALAGDAAVYAAQLAREGRFAHSAQPRGNPPQGETLWTGTRAAYRFDEMAQHWIDERRLFRDAPTPDFSTNGRWEDVAHYTQIVWGRTTQVGCALASNAGDDYLVCRYLPAGNVIGETVLAK